MKHSVEMSARFSCLKAGIRVLSLIFCLCRSQLTEATTSNKQNSLQKDLWLCKLSLVTPVATG